MKIKNLTTIAATGQNNHKFIGIRIRDNRIEFHYPETYVLSDDDDGLRRDILSILRTISLAKTTTSDQSTYNTQFRNSEEFPLGAYLWIINDYLTYGRYENREKFYIRGYSGRINWRRTMRSNPCISDGNVIYTDIISEKKQQNDNLLTEIYNFCVQKAIDDIGWLYGVSFDANGIDYRKLFNKKLYLGTVNTEITHTFDDQKKTRLQNMKNILTGLDEDQVHTREVIYGVDSYEYVFERMIDEVFSHVDDIREFYPNAMWDLILEKSPIASSSLRPDTVLIRDNKVYILDAKYYRYGTTFVPGDMPETSSIQKQITYGEHVRRTKLGQFDGIYSAFLLPYSKTKNIHNDVLNQDLQFIGIAEASWTDSMEHSSRRIVAILIDTNFLVNSWIHRNVDNREQIINIIERNVGGVVRDYNK